MAATSQDRLTEWRNHRVWAEGEIRTLPYQIRTAAQIFDLREVERLAMKLVHACGEYERTTAPIAEWEKIVATDLQTAGDGDATGGETT
jgi:hypothetical protein